MMNIYHEQSKNTLKTWFLMTGFFVIVIALGWVFSLIFENEMILIIAIIFSLIMNVVSYWYSDKIVLGMYRAKQIQESDAPELWNIVENLAITAGLPMPNVFIIPDDAPNAFATGRDKEHAVVAVTSGLVRMLSRTELEGVIAHELSHIGNRDILLSTVVIVLVGFVSILSHMFLRATMWGGARRDSDRGNGNAILMLVGLALAILAPISVTLIQLAISRKREYLADASGALLTRYPEGLASALEKIASYGGRLQNANNATAHLFISNPFGRDKIAALFSTHPAIADRIRILRGME